MNLLPHPFTDSKMLEKLIPQRRPMIMVDKIVYYDEKIIISGLTISKENLFVAKGFFSETGLLEHMAQTTALYMGYTAFRKGGESKEGYIAAIKEAIIHKLPKVSEAIETHMEILYEAMGMLLVKGHTLLNGKTIATIEMTTMLKKDTE